MITDTQEYKYGFQRILGGYSREGRGRVRRSLCEAWGVSSQRYYQIINATSFDPVNLSADQAVSAAKVLNVTVADILTPSEMVVFN